MFENWQPIQDLPETWIELSHQGLDSLAKVWAERREVLTQAREYKIFMERLGRRLAIETGIIERLYTLDRGITQLLIEKGLDEVFVPHGATDKPVSQVMGLIRDQEAAIEGLFRFVKSERQLSTSYIKELHQALTAHQDHTEALDQFGRVGEVRLLRGAWKIQPNNPKRANGTFHVYCPPEQTAQQMEQLVAWHLDHLKQGVSPEVEAAWLHHRFTQIHPFQDGNGRVARCLATLVFIRAGWFPLVVTRDDRSAYIEALEQADAGDLKPLVDLFARAQQKEFLASLSLSEQVLAEGLSYKAAIQSVVEKLSSASELSPSQADKYARMLWDRGKNRFTKLKKELEMAMQNVRQTNLRVLGDPFSPERPNAWRYRAEIISVAKHLDYYANLKDHYSWIILEINVQELKTCLLLSFHAIGRTYNGILGCSACAFREFIEEDEEGLKRKVRGSIEPLSQTLFQFSHFDEAQNLKNRFDRWLNEVIDVGMTYWAKGVQ